MLAHNPTIDPEIFTTTFIDGLRDEIRQVVIIQQPVDLDAASSLAILQEEVLESLKRKDGRRRDPSNWARSNYTAAPAQLAQFSPYLSNKQGGTVMAEDKRGTEASRSRSSGDKLSTLRAYRRARGLCFTCGEKYGPTHKCGQTVQLHVVEELLQMLANEETEATQGTDSSDSEVEELHAISDHALKGLEGNQTMRLRGRMQKRDVIILVDSGSSTSFLSTNLAAHLKGAQPLKRALRVKIANGEILQGDACFPNCEWKCQGARFKTDFKVIPLDCYDAIIGIDWLKAHSPMEVDWKKKCMVVPVEAGKHKLQGIVPALQECMEVSPGKLLSMEEQDSVLYCFLLTPVQKEGTEQCPPEMQTLIDEFSALFEEPKGLPPKRDSTILYHLYRGHNQLMFVPTDITLRRRMK
jgi:hypothetical protein